MSTFFARFIIKKSKNWLPKEDDAGPGLDETSGKRKKMTKEIFQNAKSIKMNGWDQGYCASITELYDKEKEMEFT